MPQSRASDTVYFNGSWWVCVFEREECGCLRTCQVVFGAEPSDAEFLQYIHEHGGNLHFGPPVSVVYGQEPNHSNPKRLKRLAAKEARRTGVSTKSQSALSLLQEQQKQDRKSAVRNARDEKKAVQRRLRIAKRVKKHRGR
ncbi:YjdF family protein [Bifidobacterium subtile]|jgi:hypothetical protein|uniref:DUF2992 family protein n=1 Tax=Bifidobacterium subtile TaxID=77635 RepID=A0A087E3W9_9BIFI|nr:YjdF family protein [Bifidobacterium subtile]KFJ02470.1 hypothetical protein BISU_1669 [Bifidobacterium subtile]